MAHRDGGIDDDVLNGTGDDDTLRGGGGDDTLLGEGGDDLLVGGGGDDSLEGGLGDDRLLGGDGDDSLHGGDGDDRLAGGRGHDTINGEAGDDRITMQVTRGHEDTIDAGVGDDTLILSGRGSGNHRVVVDLSHADQVVSIGGMDDTRIQSHFEHVDASEMGGSLHATGGGADDLIIGSQGDDSIDGEGGADDLSGGKGDDSLLGGDGDDRLVGGAGDDMLDGGAGSDDMQGGRGDDTYVVDSQNDHVTEARNAGRDKVVSSIDYTLTNNVEKLDLIGSADLAGTGNQLNNVLTGNSGNNQLSGLGGHDALKGGAGDDLLDGGAGRDRLAGGTGDDTYVVDLVRVGRGEGGSVRPEDTILEGRNEGSDTVILRGPVGDLVYASTLTLGANLEQLDASQTGNTKLNLMGNVLDNTMTGNDANNVLFGLGGNDTLRGGLGNDTVHGGNGNDTFLFGRGDGQDRIRDHSGSHDTIAFDSGINPLDLVISRQANDLRLAIHGSDDQMTVKNWFAGTTNQTEIIQAGNGQQLLNTQVDQLIQAMGQFTTDTGLSWDAAAGGAGTVQQQAQFQGILAANWQS